jgi:hypothetical protein
VSIKITALLFRKKSFCSGKALPGFPLPAAISVDSVAVFPYIFDIVDPVSLAAYERHAVVISAGIEKIHTETNRS